MSKATGLSVPFLRKEVVNGNLKATKFGRRVLVKNEEFERYLDQGSRNPEKVEAANEGRHQLTSMAEVTSR
jgi:excisionase family DNA binding protein